MSVVPAVRPCFVEANFTGELVLSFGFPHVPVSVGPCAK